MREAFQEEYDFCAIWLALAVPLFVFSYWILTGLATILPSAEGSQLGGLVPYIGGLCLILGVLAVTGFVGPILLLFRSGRKWLRRSYALTPITLGVCLLAAEYTLSMTLMELLYVSDAVSP